MSFHIVQFSWHKSDPIRTLLITEEEHERWFMAEPPEGYHCFLTLYSFELDDITTECLNKIERLYMNNLGKE